MAYSKDVRGGIPITLVTSAARTTSSNSGNLKDTTANLPASGSYSIYLNVTALSPGGGGNRVRASIETSPDNGTTWLEAVQFADINGVEITTTSAARRLDFQNGLAYGAAGTESSTTPASAATTSSGALNANTMLTRDVRVVWDLGSAGTSATFAVFAICQP